MKSKSFNRDSVITLENYLGSETGILYKKMIDGYQPSNEEIRNLIRGVEAKYNNTWIIDRTTNQNRNQGYVDVGTRSPLPDNMEKFKDSNGNIPNSVLPDALDGLASILKRRKTSSFSNFNESGFGKVIRKSPEVAKVSTSNTLKLFKYSIMSVPGLTVFGLAVGVIATEFGIRSGLTCISGLCWGGLKIVEIAESTSTFRKGFGNAEFKIQVAKENLETRISSLTSELSTVKYFFGSNRKKQTTQNNSTHTDETDYRKMTQEQREKFDFARLQLESEHQLNKKERPGFYNTSNGGRNGDRPPTHYTGNGGGRTPSDSSRYSGPSHSSRHSGLSHSSRHSGLSHSIRYSGPSHSRGNGGGR